MNNAMPMQSPNSSLSIVYLPVDEHTNPLNPRYLRGNNDGSPNANVFMGKEERVIIFVFLHLIYSGNASMTTFFFDTHLGTLMALQIQSVQPSNMHSLTPNKLFPS